MEEQVMYEGAQKEAILHYNGPMLVLAGPGSGKTFTITHRICHLIKERGVNPANILVITFTKSAAGEMKDRFESLMGGETTSVSFGTFHAIFFRILKFAYRYDARSIVREEQRIQYIKEEMDQCSMEVEDEAEFVSSILTEISSVKGEMIGLDHYYSKNCSEENFKQLYLGYENRLRKAGLIDFDDMLVMCYELFTQRKDILEAWQKKYQYILVDEFQDINRVQYEIIRMLAAPENNLFIVGDDDQSIYRFRGAKPEIMLGFEKDYKDAKKVLLNINFRSTKDIVTTAGKLISNNEMRFPKNIVTKKGTGKPVITRMWQDPKEETSEIVQEIMAYKKAGFSWSDIAVLYRTNMGPGLLIEKLMEYNIPFSMRDSVPNLYDHWICKNIMAYIKGGLGDLSRANVFQFLNRPNRYISRDALEGPVINWESIKSFYQDKGFMVERVEQMEYDLRMLKTMDPVAAINYIRKVIGYDDYIRDYAQYRRMKPEELFEVLDQLKESAANFSTYESWFLHMKEYGEELKAQAMKREQSIDGVALMTMHSSKGLEYRIVYILDANEGVTPHQKAVLPADLEEERRMFYVAMTRAKERLHVNYVRERYSKKQEVSRFVREYLKQE
ncbi:ATP-dependent helicase [Lacrimispora xylanolytica]|uniref:DNA 3'-5' helicase n=1 Tax=Lacrimispora xylanolytica TaxID=29375 RepID=A0ABY7AA23_9FIRM|nr:ATP-dependent helicase [Lacrimispora xylanolytica]MBS5958923.1 ATP-dependent helicase [Clostridiales bacterium]WAJ22724.1 ATP-dependent helicase [Lacrimispora xylanolytica]